MQILTTLANISYSITIFFDSKKKSRNLMCSTDKQYFYERSYYGKTNKRIC